MAETACLRRSFSNPSETSHEFSEGDLSRALGESISFGRYMSESLAWEKWSAFSHNHYLEEAEKYSKPGSVAKMKAFFEAHYRRIGAKKQVVQEQENDDCSRVELEVEDTPNAELLSSVPALNQETTLANNHFTVYDFPRKGTSIVELLPNVIVSSRDSAKMNDLRNEEANIVESDGNIETRRISLEVQVYERKDAGVDVSVIERSIEIETNQCKDALGSNIIVTTPDRKMTIQKEAEKEKLESRSQQKSADSSLKGLTKSNLSKLSSSLARLATPVRPKKEGNGTPNNRNSAKESVEKKRSTVKSVHMSVNVNSDVNQMKQTSSAPRKTRIEKVFTPLGKVMRDGFTPSPAPSRASVNSVSRHPSATPQSETRRSKIALEKAFAKSRTLDQKLTSPSMGIMKPSTQSPTTFASFSFRTEERAAKRRELFQKRLEKEAENLKLMDNAKLKPNVDSRKSSQCMDHKATTVGTRTELLSDNIKIPPTWPQPPKPKRKPASNLARGKCSQPHRTVAPKPASENNKPTPITLLKTKKKRHENSSPNIFDCEN